ncbi:hypothetical protein B0A54_14287 [Friedmanniomyces endolithicus]|uniref:Phosphoribosylaminoimidazole-succinocarboxamide synthase n=1 Tax=Friedmanniomyces endolithicus TaxID=329885 RepID=A0A4U0U7F0_9PEZI|nr:hypothetical protein B0A54_14287 [Friedmanniomyces endolithicus]
MPSDVVVEINAKDVGLEKIASGKVREIFKVDDETLLFVATDRISAYDVVLESVSKGALLTQLSAHWFELIRTHIPSLQLHLISLSLPPNVPPETQHLLANRSMQVRRHPILPIESIVRGYITGSAWAEYRVSGTVNGMRMPAGLQESQRLETAIWTPSTKAEAGEHDENISKERAGEILGEEVAARVEGMSLRLYEMARDYAEKRGILIADTKFEFGLDAQTNELVLVDEVLTPDSSRFWSAESYVVGQSQQSYDKLPEEIVRRTAEKYTEAYEKLTGKTWR